MPVVNFRASTILNAFERAHKILVGKAVVLTDGKAGTVRTFGWTNCMACDSPYRRHAGKWPISTIKFSQNG
jgi:hypothetical protein